MECDLLFMLETIRTVVFSQIGSMIIGGVITLIVAHCYYLKASNDLRWEARAGAIQQSTLELLVAYVDWGQDLRTDQRISIGDSNNQPHVGGLKFKIVLKLLQDVGLAGTGVRCRLQPIGSENKGSIPESYPTLFITEEGKELAKYIKKARSIDQRVVELFRMPPDEQLQAPIECLWTVVPGKKPGPIDEYWKNSE